MRRNLFKSRVDTVMTIVIGLILLWFLGSLFRWAVTEARWAVITENLSTLMRGIYPQEQIQRVTAAVLLVVGLTGLSWGVWGRRFTQIGAVFLTLAVVLVVAPLFQRGAAEAGSLGAYLDMQLLPLIDVLRVPLLQLMLILCLGALVGFAVRRLNYEVVSRGLVVLWFMAIPVVLLLIRGLSPETPLVPLVPTNLWGGLLLTFMLAFVASVFCFPLGIALALGRMSGARARRGEKGLRGWWRAQGSYPVIKFFSTVYIEFFRGIPLVTVLFTANILVGFALGNAEIDSVVRAMIALTLFEAAYVAEIVRGGLQAIPPGQAEAARALGLNPVQATLLITLPQALRVVIPSLVGQFITLFKDTSLVTIVGLLDLIGIGQSVITRGEYTGTQREMYTFIALVYFVICFVMSVAARQLERSGSGRIKAR
jgi:general L-amino acid transport system permease protein